MLNNDQLAQWDRENFFHSSTHLAQHARGETPTRVISSGKGVYITDRDGRRMLDAFAGLYCVNVGYGRPEIAEAIFGPKGQGLREPWVFGINAQGIGTIGMLLNFAVTLALVPVCKKPSEKICQLIDSVREPEKAGEGLDIETADIH